jgi:hypothetical protein
MVVRESGLLKPDSLPSSLSGRSFTAALPIIFRLASPGMCVPLDAPTAASDEGEKRGSEVPAGRAPVPELAPAWGSVRPQARHASSGHKAVYGP